MYIKTTKNVAANNRKSNIFYFLFHLICLFFFILTRAGIYFNSSTNKECFSPNSILCIFSVGFLMPMFVIFLWFTGKLTQNSSGAKQKHRLSSVLILGMIAQLSCVDSPFVPLSLAWLSFPYIFCCCQCCCCWSKCPKICSPCLSFVQNLV